MPNEQTLTTRPAGTHSDENNDVILFENTHLRHGEVKPPKKPRYDLHKILAVPNGAKYVERFERAGYRCIGEVTTIKQKHAMAYDRILYIPVFPLGELKRPSIGLEDFAFKALREMCSQQRLNSSAALHDEELIARLAQLEIVEADAYLVTYPLSQIKPGCRTGVVTVHLDFKHIEVGVTEVRYGGSVNMDIHGTRTLSEIYLSQNCLTELPDEEFDFDPQPCIRKIVKEHGGEAKIKRIGRVSVTKQTLIPTPQPMKQSSLIDVIEGPRIKFLDSESDIDFYLKRA
jgi:hypothetical protein